MRNFKLNDLYSVKSGALGWRGILKMADGKEQPFFGMWSALMELRLSGVGGSAMSKGFY
jgi:hypothetical protein